jgi:hypothetical protein
MSDSATQLALMDNRSLLIALPVIAILLLATVQTAMAMSDSERYNAGWMDGQYAAQNDYREGYKIPNQQCPDGHTDSYCQGYFNGYGDLWNRSIQLNYPSTTTSQSQSADVNIKGNNNQVTVNQGQSSNSGNGNYR